MFNNLIEQMREPIIDIVNRMELDEIVNLATATMLANSMELEGLLEEIWEEEVGEFFIPDLYDWHANNEYQQEWVKVIMDNLLIDPFRLANLRMVMKNDGISLEKVMFIFFLLFNNLEKNLFEQYFKLGLEMSVYETHYEEDDDVEGHLFLELLTEDVGYKKRILEILTGEEVDFEIFKTDSEIES